MILIILFLPFNIVYAEKNLENIKIIIYNFKDKSISTSHGYYSYIIPDSIVNEIMKTDKINIQTFPVKVDYIDSSANTDVFKNHIRFLADRGKEFFADYIITGSYYIENGTIFISCQIFDVDEQKIFDIKKTKLRLGAILITIIDDLSIKINSEIQKIYTKKLKKKRVNISPFLHCYNIIRGASFGINYGKADLKNGWETQFNKADIVTVFLLYELYNINSLKKIVLLKDIAFSINYDFFSTHTSFFNEKPPTYLDFWGFTFNISYLFRFTKYFNLAFSGGYGNANSEISTTIDPENHDGPFSEFNIDTQYSKYIHLSISMNIIFDPIMITTGTSYKNILNSDNNKTLSIIYWGIGYRI